MTRTNIRDLIRKRLGETTAAFWTDTELNTWINDGGRDIVYKTKCLKANDYITTVEDTVEYTISSNITDLLSIEYVYFYMNGDTWDKLDATSRERLNVEHPGWLSADSGTPDQYYWDFDEDIIGVYVKPDSDNAGTDYIRIYYFKDYSDISSDSSTPDIPETLHMAMVDYVSALGFEQRGYGDKSNDAWQKYEARIRRYLFESKREREDDDIIMKPIRNILA